MQDSNYWDQQSGGSRVDVFAEFTQAAPAGFRPVGIVGGSFDGSFNGNGYDISDLFINRPTQDYVGLFGRTNNATIEHLHLKNVDITGFQNVGAIGGSVQFGTITKSSVLGAVRGDNRVGGLVGRHFDTGALIQNSFSTASVSGDRQVGGLVGYFTNNATIVQSFSSGLVSGNQASTTGGLVGQTAAGFTVTNGYWRYAGVRADLQRRRHGLNNERDAGRCRPNQYERL